MRTMSLTLAGLSLVATLAYAQAAPPATHTSTPAPVATPAEKVAAAAKTAAEKAEDAAEPQGYTYNAEGRRDPFVSLLRRGIDARAMR